MREKKFGMKLKDGNMKKLFRRNQIIITTLAIMIAAAGYLNYAGKKELEASSDDMVYEAGLMEISDEDLLRENQAAGYTGEIEEAAIIQDLSWFKRMFRIIIPIQKSSIISGYMLPFMTCLRELSLFLLLCTQGFILSTTLDYFDEMGLYAFSSAINLILIVAILIFNTLVNKITGASLDEGIGGK